MRAGDSGEGCSRQRKSEANAVDERRRSDQTRSSWHGKPLENGFGFRVTSLTNSARLACPAAQGLHPAGPYTPPEADDEAATSVREGECGQNADRMPTWDGESQRGTS